MTSKRRCFAVLVSAIMLVALPMCTGPAPTAGEPSAIGDRVWADLDADGLQSADEPGLPEVVVTLFDRGDVFIASTVTDASGGYLFNGLEPGKGYYLVFELPEGYTFSPQDQGGDDRLDSDAGPHDGRTAMILATSLQPNLDVDAGLMARADEPEDEDPADGDPGDPQLANACDHPYFPLRQDATWTFENLSGQTLIWTVTEVSGDSTTATATMVGQAQSPGGQEFTVSYQWVCDASGIFSPQWGIFAVDLAGSPFTIENFEVVRLAGATFPGAALFQVGGVWQNEFVVDFDMAALSSTVTIHQEITREESYSLPALDAISVPAGTFQSLHVVGEALQSNATTVSSGQVVTSTSTVLDTLWLAEGVGVVRRERPNAENQDLFTWVLVSYSLP